MRIRMAVKFLVTGDLHMGRRSARIDAASDLLSTKNTWLNIVDYAIKNGIDSVILTGDVVDRDNRYFEASGPLVEGLSILNKNNIPTYIISGNHDFDVLPQILDTTDLEGVSLLGRDAKWESLFFEKGGEKIQLIGWSFPSQHVRYNPMDTFPADMAREDMPTLVLLHGDIYNTNSSYAPIEIDRLKALRNIEAVLLGHIHKSDILNETTPLIFYTGSPHALSPKERGAHGPYTITSENGAISYKKVPLSPVRYEELNVDVSNITDEEELRKSLNIAIREFVSDLDETDHLAFLSLDILLSGKNNKIREIKLWSHNISEFTFREDFEVSVRKIEYDIEPQIDIDSLLNNPSYLGILANAIKDIKEGRENSFVDDLKRKWMERCENMILSKTYRPLEASVRSQNLEDKAECAILEECENLLTGLFIQSRDEN